MEFLLEGFPQKFKIVPANGESCRSKKRKNSSVKKFVGNNIRHQDYNFLSLGVYAFFYNIL